MAKKAKDGEMTAAEATRLTWKELGKQASGVDVAKQVKSRYGYDVPSSTVSTAKKSVFATKGRAKTAASAGKLPTESKSKTDIVRELMATGLNAPKEISETAKKTLGVSITPNHVSMIKGNLKKAADKQVGGKPAAGKKKMVRRAVSAAPVAVAAARVTAPASNLELENAALKFALKAGSVEAAMEALSRLK